MANEEMLEFVENERKKRKDFDLMFKEISARERQLHEQLAHQQAIIRQQEDRLNESRNKFKEEQYAREKEYQKELEERDRLFEQRQEAMLQRQRQMEQQFHEKLQETELMRDRLESEFSVREVTLKNAEEALEQEKQRYREENRRQIETKSQNYVNTALTGLQTKEDNFHRLAKTWSVVGAISIILGIVFIAYTTLNGAYSFHSGAGFSWTYFVFVTFRGLVVIALFAALARYAFVYSKSYMHESLKSGERRHAINFGKFYLEAYGADANWGQIKEAFQHWNIGNESAFSEREADDKESSSKPFKERFVRSKGSSVN